MACAVPPYSHRLNAYSTVIVRVSYGYGYTRGSCRLWVEIFGAGRVRVRVASSATGTGRVAEMVDPHTPIARPLQQFAAAKICGQMYIDRSGRNYREQRCSLAQRQQLTKILARAKLRQVAPLNSNKSNLAVHANVFKQCYSQQK